MAQIIIAKHRKGATGDVLLTFKGQFSRFQDPERDTPEMPNADGGSEIIGSKLNGSDLASFDDFNDINTDAPLGGSLEVAPF